MYSTFLKKLSVDGKTDNFPDLLGWGGEVDGGNFKISKWKMCLVAYHWKGLFKTKILVKVLSCNDN